MSDAYPQALNARSFEILRLIVDHYIRDGQPVASRALVDGFDLSVSPATIRNIMAELEKAGYLQSPHTSAGRIPTEKGYRLFVDHLLTTQSFTKKGKTPSISLESHHDTTTLMQTASQVLSNLTHLACIVSLPKRNQLSLKYIEFLPLSSNRVLAVLVLSDHEVQNRIIETDRTYTASELQVITNFINEHYVGLDLIKIRQKLCCAMQHDRQVVDDLMKTAINMANQALSSPRQNEDYIVSGKSHLFDVVETERLRSLFEAFTQKQSILHLLERCLQADHLQIFIGKEAGIEVFDSFSVVAAPYEMEGEVLGALGVIGPHRMPYDSVMSVVDVTAKLLSSTLSAG